MKLYKNGFIWENNMNQGERIFKDSDEDVSYNAINFKIEDKEKKNRKIKLISLSILGTIIIIGYFFLFFQQIANTSIGKLSVEKESDKITYINNSIVYKELFEVYGKPNKTSEAIVKIHYKDKINSYRVTFSNSNSWGNGVITLYDNNEQIIYSNEYNDDIIVFSNNLDDFIGSTIITNGVYSHGVRSFNELSEAEIINLVLRSNVSFRGNLYILFCTFILVIIEVYSILRWEKAFERKMKWYTSDAISPSDTYEMSVRLNQLIIFVMIIISLFAAFVI